MITRWYVKFQIQFRGMSLPVCTSAMGGAGVTFNFEKLAGDVHERGVGLLQSLLVHVNVIEELIIRHEIAEIFQRHVIGRAEFLDHGLILGRIR